MLKYTLARLVHALPVLFSISVGSFILIHLVPGDPARIALGPHAPLSEIAALKRQLGLDRSLIDQYLSFLGGAVKLSFGESLTYREPVRGLITARLGMTFLLMAYSLVLSVAITVPLAVLAAVKRERLADHAIRLVGMAFFVMPWFWLGLLLALIFGLELGWLPTGGYASGIGGAIRSLTLPALTLALAMAPLFLRSLRASIILTLDSGFVEAARARGLSDRRILYRHVLRNASISTVTLIGITIGGLVSGTVVVEQVFALHGLGPLLVSSVSARDFPTIQGIVLVMAATVVAINLLTDLAYAAIDPRVRL
jgi:peptide/nickel transport system permease protein